MPWANGGGETVEIAVSPEGASFADFDWRISSALVASPGPFSRLPAVERTLTVTSDGVLALAIDGRAVRLDRTSPPLLFSGEAAVTAEIPDGPVRDLNVMTRLGRATHAVESLHLHAPLDLTPGPDRLAVFVAAGGVAVEGECYVLLGKGDTLLLEPPTPALRLSPAGESGPAQVVVIRLREPPVESRRNGVESASD